MIPKIIHYCWFGGNSKSKLIEKCICSWKKYCPDYEVIEWNENNFDISMTPQYVQQAYEAKKWAFVTDYVRLYVVYTYGGVYLDTDVELLKSIDELLLYPAFFGMEEEGYVNTGLGFGSIKNTKLLAELINDYQNISFKLENGEYDTTGCPIRNTKIFVNNGMKQKNVLQELHDGTMIFPEEYFCPKNYRTGEMKISSEAFSIHHYDASWFTEEQQKAKEKRWKEKKRKAQIKQLRSKIKALGTKLLGENLYKKLRKQ